ncbi:SigB/SigF/SigG family RNA polymerase sigma factor [Actinocorallia longicatena]|uniref:RNA polymerase sigma-70 domain-containing protein n=1 Tax=Actinocorallia longicatena TaxID=111803 RepID=A0ABP6PZS1_9ACTN
MSSNERADLPFSSGEPEELLRRLAALADEPGTKAASEREDIRTRMAELYQPYVRAIARRYAGNRPVPEDVVQAGMVGLVKAVNGFDPLLGDHFHPYASITISGEIKRHFRDTTWAMHVTRRVQELRLALRRTTADFYQDQGRAPTVSESARLLEVSEDEIIDALNADVAYHPDSLDSPGWSDDTTIGDTLGEHQHALSHLVDIEAVRPLLESLPARERTIVLLRFWGNKTQSDIAAEMGISQMHVSRLLAQTLKKLRAELEPADPL